jgi:hypothetical protein
VFSITVTENITTVPNDMWIRHAFIFSASFLLAIIAVGTGLFSNYIAGAQANGAQIFAKHGITKKSYNDNLYLYMIVGLHSSFVLLAGSVFKKPPPYL